MMVFAETLGSTGTIINLRQPLAMINSNNRSDNATHLFCHPPFVFLCRLMLLLKTGGCGSKSSTFTHFLMCLISTAGHDGT